jgi:hypothetical protein
MISAVRILVALALTGAAVGCTAPYALRCQPELDPADCSPAAQAAVSGAPPRLGRVVGAEVCSVGVAQLCGLHERPVDVILTMADGSLIGASVRREEDGRIAATAYWDGSGRLDR